jgi:hypothetical protein
MHVIGQSRVDTWQTLERIPQTTKTRLIHRPIQVQAKSRIDTWRTSTSRQRAHSATEVQIRFSKDINHFCSSRFINLSISLDRAEWILGGHPETHHDLRSTS